MLSTRIRNYIVFLALLLVIVFAQEAAFAPARMAGELTKQSLRDAISRSLEEPEGIQYVTFGPLKDGRKLKFEITYHNHDEVPQIRKGREGNHYNIRFPRIRLAQSPFIIDAMMGCPQSVSICERMEIYLGEVQKANRIKDIPFFDDVFVDTAPIFERFRGKRNWALSVWRGIESAVLSVDLHEICHAILGHMETKTTSDGDVLRFEGEADGCMVAILRLTKQSAVGGITFLVVNLFREESFGEFQTSHPKTLCRLIAFNDITVDWITENNQNPQSNGSLNMLDSFIEPSARARCNGYLKHVSEGDRLTLTFIDTNTELHSVP